MRERADGGGDVRSRAELCHVKIGPDIGDVGGRRWTSVTHVCCTKWIVPSGCWASVAHSSTAATIISEASLDWLLAMELEAMPRGSEGQSGVVGESGGKSRVFFVVVVVFVVGSTTRAPWSHSSLESPVTVFSFRSRECAYSASNESSDWNEEITT